MGAGRLVPAGRNADKLERLVRLAGKAVVAVVLSGNRQEDAAALREAAGGGAEIAFDMVGGASEPSSTSRGSQCSSARWQARSHGEDDS
jgi:alcohol dehydrogenase